MVPITGVSYYTILVVPADGANQWHLVVPVSTNAAQITNATHAISHVPVIREPVDSH